MSKKENIIEVKNLAKIFEFSVKRPERGFWRNFFQPEKKSVTAVNDISFSVERGETLAFIGPNGAGKSTTIKMLTGILFPSAGEISVLGFNPQKERRKLSRQIGTVFGQRSQLVFNLPVRDSFRLFAKIYELKDQEAARREKELVKIFGLEEIMDQPVRKLSLGQRMRAEIAVALLHNPKIIFLDEPTIGLDVLAKSKLRETLTLLNQKSGVTIFLTSHDVGDIEALCRRTVVINDGRIVLDAKTDNLQHEFLAEKNIKVEFKDEVVAPEIVGAKLVKLEGRFAEFVLDTKERSLNDVLKEILARYQVNDMDVENPPLEEVIKMIYRK
jgi:ABC-2 type transport system ATP-binding protein